MMVKYPPPSICFSLLVNNRLVLLFFIYLNGYLCRNRHSWCRVNLPWYVLTIPYLITIYFTIVKGVSNEHLEFGLCCVIRTWIGIISRWELWKSLISRDFYIYVCIIFVVLSFLSTPLLILFNGEPPLNPKGVFIWNPHKYWLFHTDRLLTASSLLSNMSSRN